MSYTVDDTTSASSPGGLRISVTKYLAYMSVDDWRKFIYSALLRLPKKALFTLFKKDRIVFEWIRRNEQFEMGCVNPTIVLNCKQGLIATFTNLTSVEGKLPTPVIKISQEKLWLVSSVRLQDGTKLASVATYYANTIDPYATAWVDFDPKVAGCFTNDQQACNRLLKDISDDAWRCLELGLMQLPLHPKIGLHKVNLDADLVNNA